MNDFSIDFENELPKLRARVKELEEKALSWELTARTASGAFRALEEENARLRAVVDAAMNQVKLQEKNTVPSLIRAIRELDGGNVADMTLDGEKK